MSRALHWNTSNRLVKQPRVNPNLPGAIISRREREGGEGEEEGLAGSQAMKRALGQRSSGFWI